MISVGNCEEDRKVLVKVSRYAQTFFEEMPEEENLRILESVLDKEMSEFVLDYAKYVVDENLDNEDSKIVKPTEEENARMIHLDDGQILLKYAAVGHYLDFPRMCGIFLSKLSGLLKNNTLVQTKDVLGSCNDFSPEEFEAIRKEHSWIKTMK